MGTLLSITFLYLYPLTSGRKERRGNLHEVPSVSTVKRETDSHTHQRVQVSEADRFSGSRRSCVWFAYTA